MILQPEIMLNINVGILGHVDCGKTTLAKVLSDVPSTAAFDKSAQSQARGITLDLGFSAMLVDLPDRFRENTSETQLQFTLVDCPGHAKLIKTVIGGANIMDVMLLVIDIQKGIQLQTTECLIVGEIVCRNIIVVLNKIDMLEADFVTVKVDKFIEKLKKHLSKMSFEHVEFCAVSAATNMNIESLRKLLTDVVVLPKRQFDVPFLCAVDHCFQIKGHGAICTGTVLQGRVRVNDVVEFPQLTEQKKIKSIQVFKKPANAAGPGERIGLNIAQFDSKVLERGAICAPGYVKHIRSAVVKVERIRMKMPDLRSNSKLHIVVGHESSVAVITLFKRPDSSSTNVGPYDWNEEYEVVASLSSDNHNEQIFALLEFEKQLYVAPNDPIFIALSLSHQQHCRIVFWGHLSTFIECKDSTKRTIKLFKMKSKKGHISKFTSRTEAISKDLFHADTERRLYVGKDIQLCSGEQGKVTDTFGTTCKVKISFQTAISDEVYEESIRNPNSLEISLMYRKYSSKTV